MDARDFHRREADRLRSLAASTTTQLIKMRLLAQAVEHDRLNEGMLPPGPMNSLRRLARWHRNAAEGMDNDERQRRLKLAEQIERRADALEGKTDSAAPTSADDPAKLTRP